MTSASHHRITPNLFGISFGVTGLGEVWATASRLYGVPATFADVLFVVAAVLWAGILALYVRHITVSRRWSTELLDPVFAPFVAIVGIVPMLLGVVLAEHVRTAGVIVTAVSLAFVVLLGGALTGQWIVEDLTLAQWHPGYFIPTVAGGYLGSESMAALGHTDLAWLLFGYGSVSWLVLGSILLQRTFVESRLPGPLLPTMAIQMAPPVVAGAAWFEIDDGRVDGLALGLAGYAVLMAMVQLRLVPLFRTAAFGPGWWSFSFSYAAVFLTAIRWLAAEHVAHGGAWTGLLLAVVTLAMAALAVRTLLAVARGSFLPTPQPVAVPAPDPTMHHHTEIRTEIHTAIRTENKEHVA